ncbi:hypothetical protein Tco_0506128, partial [Tanacetum coccineum]
MHSPILQQDATTKQSQRLSKSNQTKNVGITMSSIESPSSEAKKLLKKRNKSSPSESGQAQVDSLSLYRLAGWWRWRAVVEWWQRVEVRGGGDRVDRVMGRLSELGRKTRRESFPVAADGGR